MDITADLSVDAWRTWKSSRVVYDVDAASRSLEAGSVIKLVVRREDGILTDIGQWCEVRGHEILFSGQHGGEHRGYWVFFIRKGRELGKIQKKIVVILSTADLEHVVYPLDKALAGALLGMDTNVVFEGSGVRLLRRGYQPKLSGIVGRFFTTMVRRLMKAEIGWPLPTDSIRMLEDLGAHFYICGPSCVGYGVDHRRLIVSSCTVAGSITWANLLACTDVHIYSEARFEKP